MVLTGLRRSSWPAALGRGRRVVAEPVNRILGAVTGIDDLSLEVHAARRRAGDLAFTVVVAALLVYGLVSMLLFIGGGQQGIGVLGHALELGFFTFLRVVVVVVVSTVIWVPVGVWIGFNPRVAQFLQPVVQVLASFPANFIFPFAIVVFLDLGISLNYGAILLMALGTQWYILFNVIAGASAVPSDLREAMDDLSVRGREKWRRLILPGIFPAFVTGAITAAGGGLECLDRRPKIVRYNGQTLTASGLGSFITQNTSNLPSLLAGLLGHGGLRDRPGQPLLWRRLCTSSAETRFALS